MTDNQIPPWAIYSDSRNDKLRQELGERIDKLGGEVADERKAREIGDKELADDITDITTRRMATWSARSWALVITGVTIIGGGLVTLIVYFAEAASHLSGGTTP